MRARLGYNGSIKRSLYKRTYIYPNDVKSKMTDEVQLGHDQVSKLHHAMGLMDNIFDTLLLDLKC